jgi:regulatory protein
MRRPGRKTLDPGKSTDPRAVRAAAFAHLARRDFASGELARKLAQQGFDASVSAATVSELAADRYIDDPRFCENYVAYHAGRGEGPVRIAAQLSALGLASELIATALASVADWRTRAQGVRARRFGAALPESWSERSRQARFLQYRGFSSDHIRAALGIDFTLDD